MVGTKEFRAGICTRPELGHAGPCNGYPAATCWRHISMCPVDLVVVTKIDDEEFGARNVDTLLVLCANGTWIMPTGNRSFVAVRYKPTHWRPRDNLGWQAQWSIRGAWGDIKSRVEVDPDMAVRAARLLLAAAEDAVQVCESIRFDVLVPMNSAMVLTQVNVNLRNAISVAKRAGIARAKTIHGDI